MEGGGRVEGRKGGRKERWDEGRIGEGRKDGRQESEGKKMKIEREEG
jgi:hypothetical protein